jgi:hypothetical protein
MEENVRDIQISTHGDMRRNGQKKLIGNLKPLRRQRRTLYGYLFIYLFIYLFAYLCFI